MKRGRLKKSKICRENVDSSKPHKLAPEGSTPSPASTVETTTPFSFKVTIREHTRLRIGDLIEFAGSEYVVIAINPSCARIIPARADTHKTVTFTPRFAEKSVTFSAPVKHDPISISANSEVPILHRLGSDWRARLAGVLA
jgi:hypothetical protein